MTKEYCIEYRTPTYLVMTIETASLRILSPNTNMFNVGSTSNAWKIASVATGSTAEIREPKAKLWKENLGKPWSHLQKNFQHV